VNNLDEKPKTVSNKDIDWAQQYDFYEVEMRDMYRTVSKPQNDSHFEMLKSKLGDKFLNKSKVFCEIGFSAGLSLRYALKYFGMVYGLDISPKNIELTADELKSEGYSNFELYTYDLMNFDPRFENKFDVLSFIHGLEHFTEDEYPVILNNIKKYLKPQGVFSGALPNSNRFNYRMCPKCNHIFEIDGHVSSHNVNSVKKVFENNGFEIIHLSNFNFEYALSRQSTTIRRILVYIFYGLLKKQPKRGQLEYIVKPKNYTIANK